MQENKTDGMQGSKENETPEFSLSQLRADAKYSEETKGIEFGANPGRFDSDYIKWVCIIAAILSIIGGVFQGIVNNM